jgi:hypothetical protein
MVASISNPNTKKSTSNPRRKELIALSNAVKPLLETGDFGSINDAIKEVIYEGVELNTFKGWIDKGFSVIKGEKALLLWGAPRKTKQADAEQEEEGSEFFPVCYVFSKNQVEPLKNI